MNRLETFFTNDDIKDIYDKLTIYGIKKYKEVESQLTMYDENLQKRLKHQYHNALITMQNRQIEPEELKILSVSKLETILKNYQQVYNSILELNKPITEEIANEIETTLLKRITNLKEVDKLSFLFDFFVEYITYSKLNFWYCNQLPLTSIYDFDFQNNIPIDDTYESVLTMGQGLCNSIANTLKTIAQKSGLQMHTITATHNDNFHALNLVVLKNRTVSLIDVTAAIKDKVSKKSCFLVSSEDINTKGEYLFTSPLPTTTTYINSIPNYQEEAHALTKTLKQLRPQATDLNHYTR